MWCLNSLVEVLIKSIEFRQLLLLCEISPKALLKNVQTSSPIAITCEYPFVKRKLFVKGSYLNFNKCTKSKELKYLKVVGKLMILKIGTYHTRLFKEFKLFVKFFSAYEKYSKRLLK
jgi:hypothetical protein